MELSQLNIANNGVDSDTLIIGLHGLAGNGAQHKMDTGLGDITNASVICPNAPTLNDAGKRQWRVDILDDAYWLMGLIQYMITHHGIDPAKVHVNGQSNGGAMAYALADIYPSIVQSVTVSATYFPLATSNITAPVVHIHGMVDDTLPIAGVEANTFPKIRASTNLLPVLVDGAGHSIQNSIDLLPTLNEKLALFGQSVLSYIKSNAGL